MLKERTITRIKNILDEKDGELVTSWSSCKSVDSNALFRCKNGHTWRTCIGHIIYSKSWCPYCAKDYSVGEEITRRIFEYLFDKKFSRSRPPWLIGPGGGRMELDGFCEELKLAFEYNGGQHYKESSKGMFEETYRGQNTRDRTKKRLCRDNNINLIEVKYFNYKKPDREIFYYVIDRIRECGIKVLQEKIKINTDTLFKNLVPDKILLAQERADKVGLIFLGIKDGNKKFELKWRGAIRSYWYRCKKCKYEWEKTARTVTSGYSCPKCVGVLKRTLEECQEFAKDKRGECLSGEYISIETRMFWQCEFEHVWEARFHDIKDGHWCPYCSGNKKEKEYTYEEAQQSIRILGIKTLSEYRRLHKLDSNLPTDPHGFYKRRNRWINWHEFAH
jgi:hypothetical protein